MVTLDKDLHSDLIATTQRILRLSSREIRVTDNALICKNPNYSLCDAMLKTDTVYCIEYLLSYWEERTGYIPCFVFKHTGCAVSLCCYVRVPAKLIGQRHVKDFNVLSMNESLIVSLRDIEQIKPSANGVLTNCVVRQSTYGSDYSVELVAFGPEDESEYEKLLRELYVKKTESKDCSQSLLPVPVSQHRFRGQCSKEDAETRRVHVYDDVRYCRCDGECPRRINCRCKLRSRSTSPARFNKNTRERQVSDLRNEGDGVVLQQGLFWVRAWSRKHRFALVLMVGGLVCAAVACRYAF